MKLLLILLFVANISTSQATLVDCNDPAVRLSVKRSQCNQNTLENQKFDIPSLGIDFGTLEMIYRGAESSGGFSQPMRGPRRTGPADKYKTRFKCTASLLSDGAKSISFISEQKFLLDEVKGTFYLNQNKWDHYLIEGQDFNTKPRVAVAFAPNITIDNYKVSLKHTLVGKKDKVILSVCESKLFNAEKSNSTICSETERGFNRKKLRVQLKSKVFSAYEYNYEKTLRVSCKRKK